MHLEVCLILKVRHVTSTQEFARIFQAIETIAVTFNVTFNANVTSSYVENA